MKQAPLKKSIYSLPALMDLCRAANQRYLEFVSQIEDPSGGLKQVKKVTEPIRRNQRSCRGFNVLSQDDHRVLLAVCRGEFNISGLTNKSVRQVLGNKTGSQVSRVLKRLRVHGLIKEIGRTYKYYITKLVRATIITALKLREMIVIPAMVPASS